MRRLLTSTALVTALVMGGLLTSIPASAQNKQPCIGENCPSPDMQDAPGQGKTKKRMKGVDQDEQMEGQAPEQGNPRKRKVQGGQQGDDDMDVGARSGSRQRAGTGDWKFDSNRHQRRRSKDATFRFHYDGYWYPQPYWDIYIPRRVSCGEGRRIVEERFYRVRVIECDGSTYTYLGRRRGDTYRIFLNARTGRIVDREMM